MMEIVWNVERPDFEDMRKNAHRKAMKHGATKALEWFADKRLPRRFDGTMSSKLSWKSRDVAYSKFKERYLGVKPKPHVFSGDTLKRFRQGLTIKVTKKKMQIIVTGLGRQYGRTRRVPNLRDELQRFADDEAQQIAEILGKEYIEFMKSPAARVKRRKKKIRG